MYCIFKIVHNNIIIKLIYSYYQIEKEINIYYLTQTFRFSPGVQGSRGPGVQGSRGGKTQNELKLIILFTILAWISLLQGSRVV